MWPFTKYYSILDSGFLEGATDWHCHILPGVDDGIRTMESALEVLDYYHEIGIREVWLTPHIMEDVPNKTGFLRERFAELQAAYSGPIRLRLAAENMLDALFEQRLAEGDLLTFSGKFLLVETSYFNPPMDMDGIISKIKSAGLFPILAHPERYMYMDEREYAGLKAQGVLFQLNLPSLVGAYGSTVRSKAEMILKKGWYDLSGTDLHRKSAFTHLLDESFPAKIAARLPSASFFLSQL